jgi:hypothetical protein
MNGHSQNFAYPDLAAPSDKTLNHNRRTDLSNPGHHAPRKQVKGNMLEHEAQKLALAAFVTERELLKFRTLLGEQVPPFISEECLQELRSLEINWGKWKIASLSQRLLWLITGGPKVQLSKNPESYARANRMASPEATRWVEEWTTAIGPSAALWIEAPVLASMSSLKAYLESIPENRMRLLVATMLLKGKTMIENSSSTEPSGRQAKKYLWIEIVLSRIDQFLASLENKSRWNFGRRTVAKRCRKLALSLRHALWIQSQSWLFETTLQNFASQINNLLEEKITIDQICALLFDSERTFKIIITELEFRFLTTQKYSEANTLQSEKPNISKLDKPRDSNKPSFSKLI